MKTRDELQTTIIRIIEEILDSRAVKRPPLAADTSIDRELGLDSLDWATVVVRLDEETGMDPFRQGVDRELQTIADLVDLYAAMRS